MFPAALAVVIAVFPVERRGRALALLRNLRGAHGGGAAARRLAHLVDLAGDLLGRRPVAVVAIVLAVLAGSRSGPGASGWICPGPCSGRSVWADGAGLAAGVDLGLDSVATWACIVGGLVVLAFFCWFELRAGSR